MNFNYLKTKIWLQTYWFRLLVVFLLGYVFVQKDISFQFNMNGNRQLATATTTELKSNYVQHNDSKSTLEQLTTLLQKVSLSSNENNTAVPPKPRAVATQMSSNFTTTVTPKEKRVDKEKYKKELLYIDRFSNVAQTEMEKYGIPASIKLAQALLETNVGTSRLATKNYNHFGMKCFSKKCRKGHCSNFSDDSHKDFFRIYDNAWESYRAHSLLLTSNSRYKNLFKLDKTDYKAWAKGLKKAGYATDKNYAEKLIRSIEELQLYKFDK